MRADSGRGRAPARAALAGNPSDGYGGAVLAIAVPAFEARASAVRADAPRAEPESELVSATIARFARELAPDAVHTAVSWTSTIPRCVGLGGSSAIVIATLRALCELHEVRLGAEQLASLALAVEVEELGIAAGLQDRLAQACGGLTFMEFGSEEVSFEALDPASLPPLLVAWRSEAATQSGPLHRDLRERFARGERAVRDGVSALAAAAREARRALIARDHPRFAAAVDATFDARRLIVPLDPRHVEMIELARACGASANYAGSGGAIVAVCRDAGHRERTSARLRAAGYELTVP